MASLALQMAAVWSFDWPPADRTASWKYGLFPSVKEQVGRPLCPSFPTWVLPHSIAERERQCADCFNLETSLQNRRILLVCGVNQLQTDSLIMDHFKTFCWNTAAAAEVCACECVRKSWKEISCMYPWWHLHLVQAAAEEEHLCMFTRTYPGYRLYFSLCMWTHHVVRFQYVLLW